MKPQAQAHNVDQLKFLKRNPSRSKSNQRQAIQQQVKKQENALIRNQSNNSGNSNANQRNLLTLQTTTTPSQFVPMYSQFQTLPNTTVAQALKQVSSKRSVSRGKQVQIKAGQYQRGEVTVAIEAQNMMNEFLNASNIANMYRKGPQKIQDINQLINMGLYNANSSSIMGMTNPQIVIQQNNIVTQGNIDLAQFENNNFQAPKHVDSYLQQIQIRDNLQKNMQKYNSKEKVGSNVRQSAHRRLNSTLGNYKNPNINRVNVALEQAYDQKSPIQIPVQFQKFQRAVSNLRPQADALLNGVQTEVRSKSNVKEPNAQLNNFLYEKQQAQLKVLQSPTHEANQNFKYKRSESVINNRPTPQGNVQKIIPPMGQNKIKTKIQIHAKNSSLITDGNSIAASPSKVMNPSIINLKQSTSSNHSGVGQTVQSSGRLNQPKVIAKKDIQHATINVDFNNNKINLLEITETVGGPIKDLRIRLDQENKKFDHSDTNEDLEIVGSKNVKKILSGSNEQWTDQRIKEFNMQIDQRASQGQIESQPQINPKSKLPTTVVAYETFESSSGEEAQFLDSEANSFQNKEKNPTSYEKEAKRLERQKRKFRKINDKVKQIKDEERQKQKRKRVMQLKLQNLPLKDEIDDDMLQFKDSDRDEVIEYFRKRGSKSLKRVDTPTRLLNNSNDFLPVESIDISKPQNQKDEVITPRKEMKILKQKLLDLVDF